jgi:hypothetical protein
METKLISQISNTAKKASRVRRRLLTVGSIAVMAVLLAGCFGDGTYAVGNGSGQVPAGTYRSTGGSGCLWSRLSDLTGSPDSYITGAVMSGPDVVTVLPSDGGFETDGCGTWFTLPATGPEVTSFGDGGYAIGIDIAPGTYSAPGGSDCYWEQDSDFLWVTSSLISDGGSDGPQTVQLASNAVLFFVQGCGTWTKS